MVYYIYTYGILNNINTGYYLQHDGTRACWADPLRTLDFRLFKVVYDSWNYIIDIYQMQMEDMRAWWPTWDLWLCQLLHNSWNIFDSYQMQFKDKINNGYFWGIWHLDLQLSHSSGGYEGMLTSLTVRHLVGLKMVRVGLLELCSVKNKNVALWTI